MSSTKDEGLKSIKRFELTLVWREDNQVKTVDNITDDNLISLLQQFQFTVLNVRNKMYEDMVKKLREEYMDDDIPF